MHASLSSTLLSSFSSPFLPATLTLFLQAWQNFSLHLGLGWVTVNGKTQNLKMPSRVVEVLRAIHCASGAQSDI
jgi:hypothetical protein